MISINDALNALETIGIKKAFTIEKCVDIGDRYAFYIEVLNADPQFPTPGLPILCVNKETCEITELTIPPIKNLDILRNGAVVELPR